MTRRTVARVLALGVLVALVVASAFLEVPYVTMSPGPTVDVLGEVDGRQVLQVDGRRTYPTEGELRLTTVSVSKPEKRVTLIGALTAWIDPDRSVYPYAAIYGNGSSDEAERQESAVQMATSQDAAAAAALSELGIGFTTYAEVRAVTPGGPSDGELEPRDRIVSIDGRRINGVEEVLEAVRSVDVGEDVRLVVRRDGKTREVTVTTGAAPDDPSRPLLGIVVSPGFEFPFDIELQVDERIGGPSAGLVFAVSLYDALTPGSLTGGRVMAGTGTITPEGEVGPIGGIQQKIVGAEEEGAELFLVPPDNCESALEADVDPEDMRLVRADSLASAVRSIQRFVEDPQADLPRCTA